MLVTVLLSAGASNRLRQGKSNEGGAGTAAATEVESAVRELGLEIQPMFPDTSDPKLATYFKVEVPDQSAAESVVASLNRLPDVEAAYWKPAEELP